MALLLTNEHIKNHFIENPEWKRVYFENYSDYTPATYLENAKTLFEKNGYSFKINEEIESERMGHLIRMDLHGPINPKEKGDDGFVFGNDWKQCKGMGESYAVQQLIVAAVCEYLVEFENWK